MNLLERPIEILIYAPAVAFVGGWGAALTSEAFRKSDFMQKGKKMRTIKKEAPKVKGVRLTPRAAEVARTFKSSPATRDVELLWGALLACYGSRELVEQAVQDNPQILNPAYSFPNTILESKRVMRTVMAEEEALEVMRLNPAVLQCGPSLDDLGAAEIKSFAYARSLGNSLIPPAARPVLLGILIVLFTFTLAGTGADDLAPELRELLDVLRPVLGVLLGGSFIFTAYAAARSN